MPCDSRITRTQMTEQDRLIEAMKEVGFDMVNVSEYNVIGRKEGEVLGFQRSSGGYVTTSLSRSVAEVGRKYAELGVRSFALRRGFSVTESDGVKMTLTSRR